MPVAPVPAPAIDVAKLGHSMIDLAPTEFTRDAMLGAALALNQRENPLRLNLFATAIRIFLDHVMDALAPREQVEASRWFEPVEGQDKPMRNARLRDRSRGGPLRKIIPQGLHRRPCFRSGLSSRINSRSLHQDKRARIA